MKFAVEIRAEAVVPVDADTLWSTLEQREWPWSRLMAGLGARAPGGASVLRLRALLGSSVPIPVRVLVVEPGRELRWRGGIPWVFVGEHYIRLEREGSRTRVTHGEIFTGVIGAPLIATVQFLMRRIYAREIRLLAAA